MPRRTAVTRWRGSLEQGVGSVELASSGLGTYEVSFPTRAAEEAGGHTNPEELIAAAHASCFAMQFSALLSEEGGKEIELAISATVHLGPDPAGGRSYGGVRRAGGSEHSLPPGRPGSEARRRSPDGPDGDRPSRVVLDEGQAARPVWERRRTIPDQKSSTMPKGHAPERRPWALEGRQPAARPMMKRRSPRSRVCITIVRLTATAP